MSLYLRRHWNTGLLERRACVKNLICSKQVRLEMWANAQFDGRPAEYRWRPLFNAAKVCWRPLLDPCSNTAKTRNQLKFAGVPQTNETISAASRPKFTILWGHMEDILLLNKFFPIVDTCLSCEDIARQNCAMVPRWRFLATFLRPVFSANRVQHVSDLHLKFALRPHHVWKYGRHPICGGWDYARKKRKKKEEQTTAWKYGLPIT